MSGRLNWRWIRFRRGSQAVRSRYCIEPTIDTPAPAGFFIGVRCRKLYRRFATLSQFCRPSMHHDGVERQPLGFVLMDLHPLVLLEHCQLSCEKITVLKGGLDLLCAWLIFTLCTAGSRWRRLGIRDHPPSTRVGDNTPTVGDWGRNHTGPGWPRPRLSRRWR